MSKPHVTAPSTDLISDMIMPQPHNRTMISPTKRNHRVADIFGENGCCNHAKSSFGIVAYLGDRRRGEIPRDMIHNPLMDYADLSLKRGNLRLESGGPLFGRQRRGFRSVGHQATA